MTLGAEWLGLEGTVDLVPAEWPNHNFLHEQPPNRIFQLIPFEQLWKLSAEDYFGGVSIEREESCQPYRIAIVIWDGVPLMNDDDSVDILGIEIFLWAQDIKQDNSESEGVYASF